MNAEPSAGSPVLVGIPAYNEEATVGDVVASARGHADEVLVVDDGSDDETRVRAREAGATVIAREENEGYGATLATIFRYARDAGAQHLVIADADGQHDIDDVPDMVRMQRQREAQIVTGSRFGEHSSSDVPRYRRFGLAVINSLTNLGLRIGYSYPPISDTQCGFRAYDSEAIETLAGASDLGSGMGASLDILFTAAREGYDVVEMPTRIDYDVEAASTRNPVRHGLDLLGSLCLAVFRDRPVRATLAAGAAALAGGAYALALAVVGVAAIYLLAPVLIVLALVLFVTVGRSRPRSDSTER